MPTFTVRWIDPADRTVRTVCLRDTSCARVIMRLESIGVEAQSVGAVIEPRGLRNVTLIVCGVGLILLVGSAQFPAIAVLVTVAAMLATSLIVGPLLRARFQSRRLIAADEELTVDRLRQCSDRDWGRLLPTWFFVPVLISLGVIIAARTSELVAMDPAAKEHVANFAVAIIICATVGIGAFTSSRSHAARLT